MSLVNCAALMDFVAFAVLFNLMTIYNRCYSMGFVLKKANCAAWLFSRADEKPCIFAA